MEYAPWAPLNDNSASDWAMVFLTGVATFLVFQTVRYTKGALEEAKSATAAANRTVDETRIIGEAQTRAYLSLKYIDEKPILIKYPMFEYLLHGEYFVENNGLTPSKNFISLAFFKPLKKNDLNFEFDNLKKKITRQTRENSVFPKEFIKIPIDRHHSKVEHCVLNGEDETKIYFGGIINYTDVFKKHHEVMFCFLISQKVHDAGYGDVKIVKTEYFNDWD